MSYYDERLRARAKVLGGQGQGHNNIMARTAALIGVYILCYRYIQSDSPNIVRIVM
jgi:hypothetical protein